MKKAVLLAWLLLCLETSMAQPVIGIVFKYDQQPLPALPWLLPGGMQISDLKFYLTSVSTWKDGQQLWKEADSYHLIDASDTASLALPIASSAGKIFDAVEFYLGVDSAKSESGIMDGDLDPLHGMYWTWQSGYIHFRMEGSCSVCPPPRKEFQLHIGGYRHPHSTVLRVLIPCKGEKNLRLNVDLKPLLNQLSFPEDAHVMSPGVRAKALAAAASGMFSLTAE